MNTAAINILVHVFQCTYICTSIGCAHKKRVTDSLGMFKFISTVKPISNMAIPIFRVPATSYLHQHLVLCVFSTL